MPGPKDIIHDYLNTLSNPSNLSQLQRLQDSRQEDFDSVFLPDAKAHLPCMSDPLSFEGSLKNGWCRASFEGGRTLEGFFHEGLLVGNVLETVGEVLSLYYCKKGVKHGFTRSVRKCEDGSFRLDNLGVLLNGSYEGFRWKGVEGGGFYLLQEGSLKAAFIYPDFSTVMLGTLDDSHPQGPILSSPLVAQVSGTSWIGGVLVPHFQPCPEYNPLIEDAFEGKHVFVSDSNIPNAGQGLFSTDRVRGHGCILAYFHGMKARVPSNSEYSIRLDDETVLDIPFSWLEDGYRATLGHKVCHSFEPNAEYSYAFHPLYGRIRCIRSLKSIDEGEEITCNYKYSLKKRPPPWYMESLTTYMDKLHLTENGRKLFQQMLES